MRTKRGIFLLPVGTFLVVSVFAQGLPEEHVDVFKPYRPSLNEMEKIHLSPNVPMPDTVLRVMPYVHPYVSLQPGYVPTVMKPVPPPGRNSQSVQNNLLRAALGTQWSPLLEAYLSKGRSTQYHYGLEAKYRSATSVEEDFKDMSLLSGRLYGMTFYRKMAVSAHVDVARKGYRFYAVDTGDAGVQNALTEDALRNEFDLLDAGLVVRNTSSKSQDVNYRLAFDYKYLKQHARLLADTFNVPPVEHNTLSEASLSKLIGDGHAIGVELFLHTNHFQAHFDTMLYHLRLQPGYQFQRDRLKFTLAAGLLGSPASWSAAPTVHVAYQVVDDRLTLFTDLRRVRTLASFGSVAQINPFVVGFTPFMEQTTTVSAGLHGVFADHFRYRLQAARQWFDQLTLYNPWYGEPVYYRVDVYTDAKAVELQASATYQLSDRVQVVADGMLLYWQLRANDQPFGLPRQKGSLKITYSYKQRLLFDFALFAQGATYCINPAGDTLLLRGFADPNLQVTYMHNKQFAFWAGAYNVAGMKQRQWYGYTTYGVQARAGIDWRF